MVSHIDSTTVTRNAWAFLLKNFPYFLNIALLPFVLSIAINGYATFSFLQHHAIPQALTDGLGALVEAFWGVRWFQFILQKDQTKQHPKFAFGKKELLYFCYSFLLLTPFMLDDFLFIKKIRLHHAFLYATWTLGLLILFLRFELLFPALSIGKRIGLEETWKASKPYWKGLFQSYSKSFMVILPITTIILLWLGLLLIGLWAAGILHLDGWDTHHGWAVLLERNPLITWLYIVFKEGLWIFYQAFTMVIAATYYKLSNI